MNIYRLEPAVLTCALEHIEEDSIQSCETCKKQAEKIESVLYLWKEWPEVRNAIKESNLAERVTTLDLEYKDGDFITPENLNKLSTAVTPQPIVFGFSEQEKTPFLVIRYLDRIHNENEGIDPKAKSFVTVVLGTIPQVGVEQFMRESKFVKAGEGFALRRETMFNVDGGIGVTNHVVKLIKGKLEGKTVA